MTLEELQRLSDSELIEKVATDVMTWRKDLFLELPYGLWTDQNGLSKAHTSDWNPLTDWNHTMEVVDKFPAFAFEALYKGSYHVRFSPDERWRDIHDASAQRAICLAALLAVSA